MNEPFGKFYAKTFTGSMRGAGSHVIALMAYCIANAKPPEGDVEINLDVVAFLIGDPPDRIKVALEYLTTPDPESRIKDQDGRRLVPIGQFLYRLVNWKTYRDGTDYESRRIYWKTKQAEYREKQSASNNGSVDAGSFEEFWQAYPKRVGKGQAVRALKLALTKTNLKTILQAVKTHSASESWTKKGGKFIPHPATWLNGERWLDEKPNVPTARCF